MDSDFNQLKSMIAEANERFEAFKAKPTKAENKRIRKLLTQIKNLVTPARKELVEMEKNS